MSSSVYRLKTTIGESTNVDMVVVGHLYLNKSAGNNLAQADIGHVGWEMGTRRWAIFTIEATVPAYRTIAGVVMAQEEFNSLLAKATQRNSY